MSQFTFGKKQVPMSLQKFTFKECVAGLRKTVINELLLVCTVPASICIVYLTVNSSWRMQSIWKTGHPFTNWLPCSTCPLLPLFLYFISSCSFSSDQLNLKSSEVSKVIMRSKLWQSAPAWPVIAPIVMTALAGA